jgi:peptidoglycan/LPS O-acetylase OafA/YrhL
MIDRSGAEAAAKSERSSDNISILNEAGAKQRFHLLDDFRGVAIILVFLFHCFCNLSPSQLSALLSPWSFASTALSGKIDLPTLIAFFVFFLLRLGGWMALPMFFVVSGFCIHLTYCQPSKPDLGAFYIRRFFRIYPPYLLALLFFAFVFPWSRLSFNKLTYWGQLVTHLLLCHNMSGLSLLTINPTYWTIAVEAQLYLLFPLLLLFARRWSFRRALLLLGFIEVSLHTLSVFVFETPGQFPVWLWASPFFFCFSWSTGAALADAYLTGKPLPFIRIHPAVWLVPGIATSIFPAHEFSFSFFALFTVSIISRHLSRGSTEERRSYLGRFIRKTGIYSYSIYLIHSPILLAVIALCETHFTGMEKNPFLTFAVGVSTWLLVFPLGALMYHCVEKPSISFGKRLLRARSRWLIRQSSRGMTSAVDVVSS